jgi:pyruvate dehydrogenase E1 component alpha subunit
MMVRIRMVEEEIARRYSEQEMRCPTHLSIGQEAVPAALSLVALPSDFAVSTHRGHAHFLGKGGSLRAMISEIYGRETGCSRGKGGSMHLIDTAVGFMGTSAIVGNSIPIGVGLGLSSKYRRTSQVSFVFFGEGATEEGVFYESINFAALHELPVVFVCENNLYSVYSPLDVRQPRNRDLVGIVSAMGIPSVSLDGNDYRLVYESLQSAVESVRRGEGPRFMEYSTYRHLEHCGPNSDDDLAYRPISELSTWFARDPLVRVKERFSVEPTFAEWLVEIEQELIDEIEDAFYFAKSSPFPSKDEAFLGEYA